MLKRNYKPFHHHFLLLLNVASFFIIPFTPYNLLLYGLHSTETKMKISAGVRKLWEMKRGRKMVQESCCFEWQNLIAEASRQGFVGQEELQWNSYETLDEQLKQEWLASVEERKQMVRAPVSNRAPKSPEQRRKIAEAIAAKWADPVSVYVS